VETFGDPLGKISDLVQERRQARRERRRRARLARLASPGRGHVHTFARAALYGVALLLLHRATPTSQLPLGPFIVLGTLAVIAA
jgi:hypothetical protein